MMHRLARLLPPEPAHNLTVAALKTLLVPKRTIDPRLKTEIWGQTFASPLGMAAGFDKQGQAMGALLRLGFGFTEVGSITPKPQPGNAKPRVFRAPSVQGVINRYGFNSHGHDLVGARLHVWRHANPMATLGINLGMNKDCAEPLEAYVAGIERFERLASYLVVNLSSPNTAGLRDQQTAGLRDLIEGLKAARTTQKPLLLKVAPDLLPDQIEMIAGTALEAGLDGLIVSNTTLDRPDTLPENLRGEAGGLSGAPLTAKALACLSTFYSHTKGKLPLIGVGGICSGADAVARLKAGADLLQVYSALLYRGLGLVQEINAAIVAEMERTGAATPRDLKHT